MRCPDFLQFSFLRDDSNHQTGVNHHLKGSVLILLHPISGFIETARTWKIFSPYCHSTIVNKSLKKNKNTCHRHYDFYFSSVYKILFITVPIYLYDIIFIDSFHPHYDKQVQNTLVFTLNDKTFDLAHELLINKSNYRGLHVGPRAGAQGPGAS